MKRKSDEMRGIRNDMTDLVNKNGVEDSAFYSNYILEAIQQITSRVKYLVESTVIGSTRTNI